MSNETATNDLQDERSQSAMEPVITTDALTMHFRRCDALMGVSLEIRPGTVFALLGENGAGKTTMIRILTGFQKPTSGSCSVCGINPLRDPQGVRRQIGYVSDAPALYDWMSVAQIGGFTASFYDASFLPNYEAAIRRYDIRPEQKIRHLSKGQRAKVALSLALAHDPSVLILDEPTSGLDPKVRRNFLESMIDRAATGRTVFLSSHQISEVERVADTIAILHRGRIRLHGPLAEIRESIHEVVLDVDDPLRSIAPPPDPAEVLTEETSGRSRQWFVRHLTPEMVHGLRDTPGVTEVRTRVATLEEIFVACTTDRPAPAMSAAI
nr:ABC transporter ATP-binding protein [Stieleria maiorica]